VVSQFPVALLVSAFYAKRIPIDFPAACEAMYLLVSLAFCLRLMSENNAQRQSTNTTPSN
jgi:hypothetical protein